MTDLPRNHEGIRIHQLSRQPTHNTAFGEYVQSHAFNLALSKRMIGVLVHFHDNQHAKLCEFRYYRIHDSVGPSRALGARGLLIHHGDWLDSLPTGDKFSKGQPAGEEPLSRLWEVTTAGKLVVQLLVEAGMVSPSRERSLPPPPPGWIDPRPKVRI